MKTGNKLIMSFEEDELHFKVFCVKNRLIKEVAAKLNITYPIFTRYS